MLIWPGDPAQSSHWTADIASDKVFRIAILSTPRTGNTWLRRLLDGVYSMRQVVEDDPADVQWDQLPPRCILQLHWDRDPAIVEKLCQYAFRKITICRHPLDVLISILHFCSVHEKTSSWVGRRAGGEDAIANVLPRSEAFLQYAAGPRADLLLSVSPQWASDPECLVVRYENYVDEPVRELAALCNRIQPAPDEAIRYAVEANALEKLRNTNVNQHFWQASPGLWKRLLTATEARRIVAHHHGVFEALGYDCNVETAGQVELAAEADANWYGLEFASLKRECGVARSQVLKLEQRLADENRAKSKALQNLESQLADLRAANELLKKDLQLQLEAIRADRWTPSVVAAKIRSLARRIWRPR